MKMKIGTLLIAAAVMVSAESYEQRHGTNSANSDFANGKLGDRLWVRH